MKIRRGLAAFGAAVILLGTGCVDPRGLDVIIKAPVTVGEGMEFIIRMEVRNFDDRTHQLYDIVVDGDYLENVELRGADPEWLEAKQGMFSNDVTFSFDIDIETDEVLMIDFDARAIGPPGNYECDVAFTFTGGLQEKKYGLATSIKGPR